MSFLQGLFGTPDVEKLKDRHDIKGLTRALRYKKESSIRVAAAVALGTLEDMQIIDPLVLALKDNVPDVRRAAAEALGNIRYSSVYERLIAELGLEDTRVSPLIVALKDNTPNVRRAATEALGKIGDARAAESLVARLKDEHDVSSVAAEALLKIGSGAVGPLVNALQDSDEHSRDILVEILGRIGAPAVDLLMTVFQRGDLDTYQTVVVKILVKIGSPAVRPLAAKLMDPDGVMACAARWVLKRTGSSPSTARWRPWYKSTICVTAWALGEIGDADEYAVKSLISTLADWHKDVRLAAADALVKIGAPTKELLAAALQDKSWERFDRELGGMHPGVRRSVAEVLRRIDDPHAPFKDVLWDTDNVETDYRKMREMRIEGVGHDDWAWMNR